MMEEKCRTCKFARFPFPPGQKEWQRGECRRRSPIASPTTSGEAKWPGIDTDKGCGDYEWAGWAWQQQVIERTNQLEANDDANRST